MLDSAVQVGSRLGRGREAVLTGTLTQKGTENPNKKTHKDQKYRTLGSFSVRESGPVHFSSLKDIVYSVHMAVLKLIF